MSIYMDNAATTPVDADVFRVAKPYFMAQFGNPSSVHSMGRKAKGAIEKSRKQCAEALHCEPEQIFFTSGATEANNWAIKIIMRQLRNSGKSEGKTLFYSPIEHKSVLNCMSDDTLPMWININGITEFDNEKKLIPQFKNVSFAFSCIWVNNELGTIQPVHSLSEYCYEQGIPLHADATQAIGKLNINLMINRGVTSLAMSGHKIGGFKGTGLLFIRDPSSEWIKPLIYGGGQERSLRAGTENVAGIVGLGAAMQKLSMKSHEQRYEEYMSIKQMHDYLTAEIREIPDVMFNGSGDDQLAHYLNVSFKGIEGESLLLALDRRGICVSSGSACNSGSLKPSYVLQAIGVPDDYINGTIRISLSEQNTLEECKVVAKAIKEEVAKLREVSPTWKGE